MNLQRYKRDSTITYALGATLVEELLETHPSAVTRVFLRPTDKRGDNLNIILTKLKEQNIEIIESTKAFNILGAKDNCLLIAEFQKECLGPRDIIAMRTPGLNKGVMLVNPSDSGNLGTIMRSAAAFGFDKITIVTPAVDPFDPKVIRASMGAIFHLEIDIVDNYDWVNKDVDGYYLAFILDKDAKALEEINPNDYRYTDRCPNPNFILVFGNEAAGLPLDFCARTGATPVYIKQSEYVDSLNLGVAASIAMHHFAD
ncbi:RNA methyltransferase [Candidatus Saccharibacteria bacterium]|nr:RNA methyltransferase [Candidatus Saccharibacteria bacterium]